MTGGRNPDPAAKNHFSHNFGDAIIAYHELFHQAKRFKQMNELLCPKCRARYPLEIARWRCDCGSYLDIDFEPAFDIDKIKSRPPNLWRYREAIPIQDDANIISFDEGFTPLLEVYFAGRKVLIKQEQLFQTGSFKDRGATVLISKVKELGIKNIVEDSSGNAGAAIAAYSARAGIVCEIYVPEQAPPAKLNQIKAYGADLRTVRGPRQNATSEALKAAESSYYAGHAFNPFFLQGTKTFAYEICEQLDWRSPDTLVLPVGNGTLLLGAAIGFDELMQAGIIAKWPKLIAVQAENCAPLYRRFHDNTSESETVQFKSTLADGIAVAEPVRAEQIIEAIRQSGGEIIIVSETTIKAAWTDMGKRGFYIEPTAAAGIAGLLRYLPGAESGEIIVSAFTGHGLKTGPMAP